ncbi:MAG: hypothetical protein ACAI38_09735 [Myxococcota bacterium]|nr:hypothetical protein [Myxococcota bacterium]
MAAWFDAAVSATGNTPGKVDPQEAIQGMLVLSDVLGSESVREQRHLKSTAIGDLKELAKSGAIDAAAIKAIQQARPLFAGAPSHLRGILVSLVLGERISSSYHSSMFADASALSQMVQCLMHNFHPGQEAASLREIEQALTHVARHGEVVHGEDAANVRDALLTMHVFLRDRLATAGKREQSLDDVMYTADKWAFSTNEGRRVARASTQDALHHIGLALRGIEHTKISSEEGQALLNFLGDRFHGLNGDPRRGLAKLKETAYSEGDFADGKRQLLRDVRKVESDFELGARRAVGGRLV